MHALLHLPLDQIPAAAIVLGLLAVLFVLCVLYVGPGLDDED